MKLGQTIQKIRNDNNLTQSDFAEFFHVTRQTVSNWENEKSYPDLLTLIEISNRFNITLDSMLKDDIEVTEKLNKDIKWGKWLKTAALVTVTAVVVLTSVRFGIWKYGTSKAENKFNEGLSKYSYEEIEVAPGISSYRIVYDEDTYFLLSKPAMPSFFGLASDIRVKDVDCCIKTDNGIATLCWSAYDGDVDDVFIDSRALVAEEKERYSDILQYGCNLYNIVYR